MTGCNYVVAAGDSFVQMMDRFLYLYGGKQFLDESSISNIIGSTIDKYLYSFGAEMNYKTKRIPKNRVSRFLKKTKEIRDARYMDKCKIYWDSGGYQISNGALEKQYMKPFIHKYYDAVNDNHDLMDYAFLMDLPPGPGTKDFFSSYDDIIGVNRYSYKWAQDSFTPEIKDKLIYIHHFRSPLLYETWNNFMFKEGLADGYSYFATGGIVANIKLDVCIPIIAYAIPLSSIIHYLKPKGIKYFKFHILGGANFIDIFYHHIISKHIKEFHDIDVEITYDSTLLFKGISIARYVHMEDHEGNIKKMEYSSNKLDSRFEGGTVRDMIYSNINRIASKYNLTNINPIDHPIYKENGRINFCITIYLMFYLLDLYQRQEESIEKEAGDIYDLYKSQDYGEFISRCTNITVRKNQGKLTPKIKYKSNSIIKTLKVLEDLDMDYNKYVVDEYMSYDKSLGDEEFDEIPIWE